MDCKSRVPPTNEAERNKRRSVTFVLTESTTIYIRCFKRDVNK